MKRQRRGFTLLEFVVALLLLGLALGALYPLTVSYSRIVESLEQRPSDLAQHRAADFDGKAYRLDHPQEWYQVPVSPAAPNSGEWVHRWYLVPSSDSGSMASTSWTRKLGAAATVKYQNPNRVAMPLAEPSKDTILELDAGGSGFAESINPAWIDHNVVPDAYNTNQHQPEAGRAATATWTFTIAEAGWYRIEVTGLVAGTTALPAGTYRVTYGTTTAEDITPSTLLRFAASQTWQPLAIKYLPAGSLDVQLTTDTTGTAIADGMRIVRCSPQITELTSATADSAGATVEIKPAVR